MIPIFLSTPTTLTAKQREAKEAIVHAVQEEGLECRTVGVSDFASQAPLKEVAILARACYGGMILGFCQMIVQQGMRKPGTDASNACSGLVIPTPWNQIEAGMLFALRKPIIVFKEPSIEGGIFDIGQSDLFINKIDPELGAAAIGALHKQVNQAMVFRGYFPLPQVGLADGDGMPPVFGLKGVTR
jgi:hypothetical protein